ncbi:MAG: class I SAM-dependent methyltransferase [bacterium]
MTERCKESQARAVNLEYYLRQCPGRTDYWRKMAAPRFRMATFLKLLAELGPESLVDLGCGSGELLDEIRKKNPAMHLCGIDLSPMLIDANSMRGPSTSWHSIDLDCEQEFPPELLHRFDAVMASEIIEHLDHPLIFLQNARALARPGGRLFLSTQSGRMWETERRVGHRRHYSAVEMQALLIEAGWKPLRVWNSGFPFHDLSKRFANADPDATMKRFSEEAYGPLENFTCFLLRLAFRLNSSKSGAQLFAVAEFSQGDM